MPQPATDASRAGIACAGNWILDVVHTIPEWPEKSGLARIEKQHTGLGGGPANVAAGLMAMQVPYPVVPVGLIGAGALGDEIVRLCREAGLDPAAIRRTADAATAQTHVMNVPADSRTFFYHPGANALLDRASIDIAGLAARGLKIFYLGYLSLLDGLDQMHPDGRTEAALLLAEARRHGMAACVDLASLKSPAYARIVQGTLPDIDYLFLNELEAGFATGRTVAAEDDGAMMRAARSLRAGGVRRAVVIHSPARIVWCGDGAEHVFAPAPVPPDRIVSAVGAGDAFATGVLHGIHESWPPEACADLGMQAAAACLGGYTATDGLAGLRIPSSLS